VAVSLCAALLVSGCATYAPRPGPPGAVLARERSPAVQLKLRDGRTVELFEPVLRVDSALRAPSPVPPDTVVAGLVFDARLGRRTPAAFPLHDVVLVSERVPDRALNNAIFVGTVVALVVAAAIWLTIWTGGCEGHVPSCS
jgi:hypothetical protein